MYNNKACQFDGQHPCSRPGTGGHTSIRRCKHVKSQWQLRGGHHPQARPGGGGHRRHGGEVQDPHRGPGHRG